MKRIHIEDEHVNKPEFQIDKLPIEVIIRIVYEDLKSTLAIFRLNTRLWEIQAKNGFWSNLFKLAHKQHTIALYVFLLETPGLTRLWSCAITDLMVAIINFKQTDARKKFIMHQKDIFYPPLSFATDRILKGNIDVLDSFYTCDIKRCDGQLYPDNGGGFILKGHDNTCDIVLRRFLIEMYLLLADSQIVPRKNIISTSSKFENDIIITGNETHVGHVMLKIFDAWINLLSNGKTAHQRKFSVAMKTLKDEYDREITSVCSAIDPYTGKKPTLWAICNNKIDDLFKAYFEFSDNEANRHWKRLFIGTHRKYELDPLTDYATIG